MRTCKLIIEHVIKEVDYVWIELCGVLMQQPGSMKTRVRLTVPDSSRRLYAFMVSPRNVVTVIRESGSC